MKLKQYIKECFEQLIKEELDIPSQDGTSDGASEEDKEKAKKATQDGEDVKFVKPGELEEESADGNKTPSEESGMMKIKEEEEVAPKVKEVFASLKELADEVNALEEFAEKSSDKKMQKLSEKLAKHLVDATKVVAELKNARDVVMQEDAEKANIYGDKVVKALGKHCKDEKHGMKIKEKYMPYIAKAHKKGKNPKEVAERIASHRFEM